MDKRKYNGGNSTKSKGKIDKRKNQYRTAINEAFSGEEVVELLRQFYVRGMKNDTQAGKIFLEYTIGKPKESVELSGEVGTGNNFNEIIQALRVGGDK